MRLKTPIDVNGEKVSEVSLTEPTFDDIAEIGVPADASSTQEKLALMKKYIARCSGLPEDVVGKIKASDAMKLLEKVTDFFTEQE